jgi:hypothetical protein
MEFGAVCQLYHQKRTSEGPTRTSEKCHNRKFLACRPTTPVGARQDKLLAPEISDALRDFVAEEERAAARVGGTSLPV